MISFFLSLIIFLINGTAVLRFYQIKNYLFKRAVAHFYLPSSRKLIFNKKEYLLYLLVVGSIWFDFFSLQKINFLSQFLNFIALLLIIFIFILRRSLIKKIFFTPKVIIITIFSFIINTFLLYIVNNNKIITTLLSLWVSQFIVFTIAISIFDLLVKPYLNYLGKKVKQKLTKNKNLKIIGIVGSYGKSSTKEFLEQLLQEKYKVISTPPRINHEYALLKFVLKTDLENYDYLIIEFGSYYLGNVKWITQYITPHIAFITGITKQHLFLFGSIENIIQGEGVEILTWMKEGILIVNQNHEYFEKLKNAIEKVKAPQIKLYLYEPYTILEQNLEKTVFKFKDEIFTTKIIFPMQIENLCGILTYLSLIDNLKEYYEKIKTLELPEGFLKLKIKENINIFDDSYNANPKGVFDSIKFFKNLEFDYKIIVFNGLFELGAEAEIIYKELALQFLSFDKIILTSNDYIEIFKEILKEKVWLIKNAEELELFLQSLKNKKIGIWIFNRFPEKIKFIMN
ncbi:MAG: hypothetical protein KatS3mg097_398 [Candidatus Parcubacteria bacterium]|nr:MAG: hypothetical protein KatS3mg097_398 [Candidatus Parcubacteria bacterium]